MIQVIKKESLGDIISLKNEYLEVIVSSYGCTILSMLVKDKNGTTRDIVLGYDTLDEYASYDAYLGALVGRVANRIKKGEFILNNEVYHLPINNGPNSLHGGIKGFSYQNFDYEIEENRVVFPYISQDNEEGFPGTLDFKAVYTLDKESLRIDYYGVSDKDTIINITNHSYFNLDGTPSDITSHKLLVSADKIACVDSDGLVTGELLDVENTPFDYRDLHHVDFSKDHPQLRLGNGYDHPFIFNGTLPQAYLYAPSTGIELTVDTSLPQAQIYTANFLDGRLGKNKQPLNKRSAICIETQNMPDSIHVEKEPTVILRKNEEFHEYTIYKISIKGE